MRANASTIPSSCSRFVAAGATGGAWGSSSASASSSGPYGRAELGEEPRLPDARLADDQHHAAVRARRFEPAFVQVRELVPAADERPADDRSNDHHTGFAGVGRRPMHGARRALYGARVTAFPEERTR
jgi:hypothetical protein